jgi:hypothetical protein
VLITMTNTHVEIMTHTNSFLAPRISTSFSKSGKSGIFSLKIDLLLSLFDTDFHKNQIFFHVKFNSLALKIS